jgi:hypothetical protein
MKLSDGLLRKSATSLPFCFSQSIENVNNAFRVKMEKMAPIHRMPRQEEI